VNARQRGMALARRLLSRADLSIECEQCSTVFGPTMVFLDELGDIGRLHGLPLRHGVQHGDAWLCPRCHARMHHPRRITRTGMVTIKSGDQSVTSPGSVSYTPVFLDEP